MALRDKLAARAQPYLQQGEVIQSVFLAQSGPSPYWSLLSIWIVMFSAGYSTVVVTDRQILVLRNARLRTTIPQGVRFQSQRAVWLGQPSGLWGQIGLNGQRFWVHKRFQKDVVAADAALHAMAARWEQQRSARAQQSGYGPPPTGYSRQQPGYGQSPDLDMQR